MSAPESTFAGKVAIVTGGSRGIGRTIATKLAAQGARVHLVARSRDDLDRTAATMPGSIAHVADVTDAGIVRETVDRIIAAEGRIDVLVNNAGAFSLASIHETDPAEFSRLLGVNLVGPFHVLNAVLPHMRSAGSGHVVTIGSIADRTILPGNAAYATGKYGTRVLHETLRAETRGSGIRATLVSPSAVDTSMWDPIDPDNREGFPKRVEMLRADDVAEAVLWALTRPAHMDVEELRLGAS